MNQYHLDTKETLKKPRSAQGVCVFLPWSEGTCWPQNLETQLLGNALKASKILRSQGAGAQHDQPPARDFTRSRERESQVGWLVDL